MEFLPAAGLWKALPARKPWHSGMLPVFLKKDLHCCMIGSAAAQYGTNSCLVADRKENFPMTSLLADSPMDVCSKQASWMQFRVPSLKPFFLTQDLKKKFQSCTVGDKGDKGSNKILQLLTVYFSFLRFTACTFTWKNCTQSCFKRLKKALFIFG